MSKEETKISDSNEISFHEKIKKRIEFVHKNAGGITLISTSAIAIGSVLIRYFSYLIECGKTMYYNIPRSLIDVSGDNILYDFFVKGVFASFLILLNLIPYFLWKSEKRIWSKLGWSIAILFSPNILVALGLVVDIIRGIKYSIGNIFTLIFAGVFIGVILFFAGFFNGICEYIHKLRRNKKNKKNLSNTKKIMYVAISFAVLIVVESTLLIFCGGMNAAEQNQFKIIEDGESTYAVIYENTEKFVITECTIDNDTISFIDIDTKKEIEKEGVEYSIRQVVQKKGHR